MRYLLIACASVLGCRAFTFEDADETIEVYYDSMDPASRAFFVNQLEPMARKLWDYNHLLLRLVPYGKSTRQFVGSYYNYDKWKFTCPHGEVGCYSNKIHGCILDGPSYFMVSEKMNLIFCLMYQDQPFQGLKTCLDFHNKSSEFVKLNNCAYNVFGDTIALSYGDLTDKVMKPLNVVPTVIITSNTGQTTIPDETALTDLTGLVCRTAENRLQGCPLPTAAPDQGESTPPFMDLVVYLNDR